MGKLGRMVASVIGVAGLVLACASSPNVTTISPATSAESVIPALMGYTVELVRPGISIGIVDGGVEIVQGYRMFCSGVWVGPNQILTAGHCTRKGPFSYLAYPGAEPQPYTIGKTDTGHDLALLQVVSPAGHPVAKLAAYSPPIGAELHLVGHPGGLEWTYYNGRVSAYRPADYLRFLHTGPWMQVQAPIQGGSSGSGAYDLDGRLVGLCSQGDDAGDGVYVHLSTIRNFLGAP